MKNNIIIKGLIGVFLFLTLCVGFSFFSDTPEKHSTDVFSLTSVSLHSTQVAYAQVTEKKVIEIINREKKKENSTVSFVNSLNKILRLIYIVIWPLLFIAGLAVDNTLVYGEIFHFDVILLSVWKIVKDLANFSLFFIALYFIIKGMIKSNTKEIQNVIKKLLIAGILIQASWFIMGAVIDLSTIAITAIGSLPGWGTETLKEDTTIMDKPILQTNTIISRRLKDTDTGGTFYYNGYGTKYIAECNIVTYKNRFYILGKHKFSPTGFPSLEEFEENICSHNQDVYRMNFFASDILDKLPKDKDGNKPYLDLTSMSGYNQVIKGITDKPEILSQLAMEKEYLIPLFPMSGEDLGTCDGGACGLIPIDDPFYKNEKTGYTLRKVLGNTKGRVGPFLTLYSSLLGYSDIGSGDEIKAGQELRVLGLFVMKMVFVVLLVLPLLAMIIVLIVRVGVLRLAIIFMPFLVIYWVFFKNESNKVPDAVSKYFQKEKLLEIIFSPVIMVFAVSISLIFMNALNVNNEHDINRSATLKESFNFTTEKSTGENPKVETQKECPGGYIEFLGLFSICDKGGNISTVGNTFLDMMEKMFAIAIMWFLLFAAIKMNAIGESVGKTIQSTAQKWLGTMPIFPVAGGVGWNTVKREVVEGGAANRYIQSRDRQDADKLRKLLPSVYGELPANYSSIDSRTRYNINTGIANGESYETIYQTNAKALRDVGILSTKEFKEEHITHMQNIDPIKENKFYEEALKKIANDGNSKSIAEDESFHNSMHKLGYDYDDHDKLVLDLEKEYFAGTSGFDMNKGVDEGKVADIISSITTEISAKDTQISAESDEDRKKLLKKEKELLESKKAYLEKMYSPGS